MIIPSHAGKKPVGKIVCGVCGVEERHPTPESDWWSVCWCDDPDRCVTCGICEKCFGKGVNDVVGR